jgi:hypothetical protein
MNKPCGQFKADMAGPKHGSWPPGYDANDYRTIAVASAAPAPDGLADTDWQGC